MENKETKSTTFMGICKGATRRNPIINRAKMAITDLGPVRGVPLQIVP